MKFWKSFWFSNRSQQESVSQSEESEESAVSRISTANQSAEKKPMTSLKKRTADDHKGLGCLRYVRCTEATR
jgi:hypothetical protein